MNDNQQPYDNRPPYNGQPQPPYGAPAQPYYQQPQVVVAQPRTNGLGTAGFVLSLLAWIFCWVPFANIILWVLGLIFSIIGLFKAPRGLAIAGFVLSTLSIILVIVCIVFLGGLALLSV